MKNVLLFFPVAKYMHNTFHSEHGFILFSSAAATLKYPQSGTKQRQKTACVHLSSSRLINRPMKIKGAAADLKIASHFAIFQTLLSSCTQ